MRCIRAGGSRAGEVGGCGALAVAAVQRRLLRLAPGGARQHPTTGMIMPLFQAKAVPQQPLKLPVQESVGPALCDFNLSKADL